jgi:hypothetical protein
MSAATSTSSSSSASPAASSSPAALAPAHPLVPLVVYLHQRLPTLGVPAPRFQLREGATAPMLRYTGDALELAGDHPSLLALAGALAEATPAHADEPALAAFVAHVISVLNLALTAVTDATEAYALGLLLGAWAPPSLPR